MGYIGRDHKSQLLTRKSVTILMGIRIAVDDLVKLAILGLLRNIFFLLVMEA